MLTLNGLRIATDNDDEGSRQAADLTWRTLRVDSLPSEPQAGDPIAIVRSVTVGPLQAVEHVFGHGGRVRCRFRIHCDGAAVDCLAVPEVSDRDIFSLFAEPIMRTVLVCRELLSFHAAALAKDGSAVLILADKGAGKSTLSWALQRQGWQLLADDLARVDTVGGRWSVFPGHRQTKLTPAAAQAFGHSTEHLPPRFDDPGPPATAAMFDKRVIDLSEAPGQPKQAVPIAGVFILSARELSLSETRIEPLSPSAAVRHLLHHVTPDPLQSVPGAPPRLQRAIGDLACRANAAAVTLPDRFDRLDQAITALESYLADGKRNA